MFYGDLRFCFRLLPGVPIAGDNSVYTEIRIERAKVFDSAEYDAKHDGFRNALAEQFNCDVSLIEKISGEEYEANVDVNEKEADKEGQ